MCARSLAGRSLYSAASPKTDRRAKPAMFDGAAVDRFYAALAREGVRVASGTWFGDEARVFRLGFGFLDVSYLQTGLGKLSKTLQTASTGNM